MSSPHGHKTCCLAFCNKKTLPFPDGIEGEVNFNIIRTSKFLGGAYGPNTRQNYHDFLVTYGGLDEKLFKERSGAEVRVHHFHFKPEAFEVTGNNEKRLKKNGSLDMMYTPAEVNTYIYIH